MSCSARVLSEVYMIVNLYVIVNQRTYFNKVGWPAWAADRGAKRGASGPPAAAGAGSGAAR